MKNKSGQTIGFRGLIRDITERKRAEAALIESSAQFRTLFEASPDAIVLIDPHDRWPILDCNPAACQMNGYTRDELVGQSIDVLNMTPGDPAERAAYMESIRQNDVLRLETLHRRKDGTVFAVEVSTSLIALGGRDVVLGIDRDITERTQAAAALRESEERYRTLVENAGEGIGLVNSAEQFTFANPAGEDIFGVPPGGLLGRSLHEFTTPEQFALIREQTGQRQVGDKSAYELEISRPDGKKRHLLVTAVPQLDSQGEYTGAFGVFSDITARKLAEQRAFELALERERVGILTKFILDASHEFRTPLTIIQANVYLLERLEDPAKRGRKLAQIGDQVTGITRLVDLLAETARLDSGVPFTTAPTDLNQWISAEAGKVQSAAAAKGLTLHLVLAPDLPPVAAHGHRLGRALHELLDNAVRFTPAGGHVTVRTGLAIGDLRLANSDVEADGANPQSPIGNRQWVTVEVTDTGPGIPPDLLPRIFERFYRQDVAHTTPGFGLGLPIARAIIERHGGRLEVESQPAVGGSVFRVRLPIGD